MKVLAIVLIVTCIAIAQKVSDEIKEIIDGYTEECVAETGVDGEVLIKAVAGHFSDEPKLKAFSLCFMKKAEFINDAGDIQKDSILEKLEAAVSEEYAKKIVNLCGDIHSSTPENTAFEFSKCFQPNKPVGL